MSKPLVPCPLCGRSFADVDGDGICLRCSSARDWFSGAALIGLLRASPADEIVITETTAATWSDEAFLLGEAMVKRRAQRFSTTAPSSAAAEPAAAPAREGD